MSETARPVRASSSRATARRTSSLICSKVASPPEPPPQRAGVEVKVGRHLGLGGGTCQKQRRQHVLDPHGKSQRLVGQLALQAGKQCLAPGGIGAGQAIGHAAARQDQSRSDPRRSAPGSGNQRGHGSGSAGRRRLSSSSSGASAPPVRSRTMWNPHGGRERQ
jgi:hypothetical protein